MKTYTPVYGNDLALARNKRGKLDLVLESDPVVASIIKLYFRFLFFLGEWYLNVDEGVPWFQRILIKNPNLMVVREIFRKILLSVATIDTVDVLTLTFDPVERALYLAFELTAVDGRKIEGGSGKPFIVSGKEIHYTPEP